MSSAKFREPEDQPQETLGRARMGEGWMGTAGCSITGTWVLLDFSL